VTKLFADFRQSLHKNTGTVATSYYAVYISFHILPSLLLNILNQRLPYPCRLASRILTAENRVQPQGTPREICVSKLALEQIFLP
jgi:hypothetical protein